VRAFAEPVPSPCVGVCQTDPTGAFCQGCLRTLGEIVDWARRTEAEKREVWARIRERQARLRDVR
jgi:predicted Fe-S protein YdhL (DUF1289 family)